MDDLFPGKKLFSKRDKEGNVVKQWVSDSLNWKAKVVCKTCNETWMSDIESKHAKPSMTDLIRLRWPLVIDEKRANSLAIFAFKTAVVFDHIARNRPPFFPRSARRRFRRHLAIPPMVRMWMAASSGLRRGSVLTGYFEGQLTPAHRSEMYACTYSVGNLVFQVVAQREHGFVGSISPIAGFERLSVPFWPLRFLPKNLQWPVGDVLRSDKAFEEYATRWKTLTVVGG